MPDKYQDELTVATTLATDDTVVGFDTSTGIDVRIPFSLLDARFGSGSGSGDLVASNNLSDVANAATALSNLGGQPLDSDLTAIAALSTTAYGRSLLTLANLGALQAVLGTGTPSASTYLRGDGTWATPSGSGAVDSVNSQTGVVVLDADDIDDTATTNKFTTAGDISKLAGIEAGADVTDATNVDAAGAVMNSDTSTAAMSFVVDEDNMASNSATKLPTQQSVKAYVDGLVAGLSSTYQPLDSDLTALAALSTTAYGRALLEAANLGALQAILGTGTPSASTYLRGDGTWATPAGSGATVSSGAGAPASTPSAVGDIYIDTTADVAYFATGTASSADWQMPMAVATSTAGTWESRPQAMIVVWAAGTDTAATTPVAATGDDIVILAEDADLTAIAALTSAANKVPYATGAGTWAMADFTAFGRTLVANADAAAAIADLGLDADLATFSVPASTTISAFGATLVDDADNTAARSTLGLGTIATQSAASVAITGGSVAGITDLAVADGGTGASTAQGAIANLRVAPATVTGTTDTLAAGDDGKVILYTAAGAVTVTLANIATGFEAVLVSLGAGGLSVAAGGMSFANSFTPKLTVAQGEALYVKQTAASTWIVLGGTAT